MLFSRGQLSSLTAALLAALPVTECSPILNILEERGTCNADNLLRLLRTPTNLPEALPFCSSYLYLPSSTLVVGTVSPTGTFYNTVLNTVSPTATSYTTDVSSIQPIQTISTTTLSLRTSIYTVTSQTTTTATLSPVVARRGAAKTPLSKVVVETYPASRISSACACLTIPVSLVSVTKSAAEVTSTVDVQKTTTAPEVTQIVTLSSTTILPEVTEIVTIESTSDVLLTVTQTSITTSTTTLAPVAPPAAPTAGYLRFGTSYIVNRNENPANNGPGASQVFFIAPNNELGLAPIVNLTPEGYLHIVKSYYSPSAVTGQESANWVTFTHPSVAYEALYANKLASINGCVSCRSPVFKTAIDSQGPYITLVDATKTLKICSFPNTSYGRGIYLSNTGTTTPAAYSCEDVRLYIDTTIST